MLTSFVIFLLLVAVFFSAIASTSSGISGIDDSILDKGDTAWMLVAAALVMIMTPAVGFFYGGMVRSKNVISVIKQAIVILALVTL